MLYPKIEKKIRLISKSSNPAVQNYLFLVTRALFYRIFQFPLRESENLARDLLKKLKEDVPFEKIEREIKFELNAKDHKKINNFVNHQRNRARVRFRFIKDYIRGKKVLDFGAGSGYEGEEIFKKLKKKVYLTDIVNRNKTNLPFFIAGETKVPFKDKEFDTVLCFNVLHHISKLELTFKELKRITKKRLIIWEEIYHGKEINSWEGVSKEEHFGLTCFQEWLMWAWPQVSYSGKIYLKLRTPKEWRRVLKDFRFRIIKEINIHHRREDSRQIPGFHPWLFVLENSNPLNKNV